MDKDELAELLRAHREELAAQLSELAEPVRAPGVQMQFGKRAGDHTADAVLQMTRTMTAGQLARSPRHRPGSREARRGQLRDAATTASQPIAPERLEAILWATRCVSCQAKQPGVEPPSLNEDRPVSSGA